MRRTFGLIVLSFLGLGADGCPQDPCKAANCKAGTHCEYQPTWPPTVVCVPDAVPSPSPSPTPEPSPSASPTPSPSAPPSPVPTPLPSPTPTPKPSPCIPKTIPQQAVKPTKKPCKFGFVESGKYCWAEHDRAEQQSTGCRACADHMGIDISQGHATLDAEGWWTDNGAYRIDAYCRRTIDGVNLISDWEWRGDCPPAAQKDCPPSPSPFPSPSSSPTPAPEGCPAECATDSTFWVGTALLSKVSVNQQGGKWLGWRYNVHGTPHSKNPTCQQRPGEATEQKKACQNPNGPNFTMSLPGHFQDDRCDKSSTNNYICHHKPEGPNGASGKGAQTGPTTFCAWPEGDPIGSPRGRCFTVDVQP